jgi:hypothetical protein
MESNCRRLAADMQALMLDGLARCNSLANPKAKQHMFQGVGRRLGAIRLSMVRMFELYPPGQIQPLPRETLEELQIYLQAYVINLYGVFDNWA